MNNHKDDNYYIEKVVEDLLFINKHMKEVTMKQLKNNEILLDSMLFRLIQIQENIKKLTIEFKMKNDYIPWFAISGIRNRIVHAYGNIDLDIVYLTLKKDIPYILSFFEKVNAAK